MIGKRIGYIRVSTVDQNPERQLQGVKIDKRFIDYASGSSTDRPQLSALLDYVREDDIILVHSMDRLARSAKDLLVLVESLNRRGIEVHFMKENLAFKGASDPISKLLLTIMGAVAEFERAIMLERQREGIAIAKKNGRFLGKPSGYTKDVVIGIKEALTTRKSMSQIAKDLQIGRTSLYKYMRKMKEQESLSEKGACAPS